MKLVSVVITAYNRSEFIEDAIRSVLDSSFDHDKFEIIAVTNFSLPKFNFQSVNFKHFIMEGTVGKFLKKGILEASGEVISFLDDDDMFSPDKIKVIYDEFEKNNSLIYFHNSQKYCDDFKNPIENFKLHSELTSTFEFMNMEFRGALANILRSGVSSDFIMFNLSSISVRRSILENGLSLLERITGLTDVAIFIIAVSYEHASVLKIDSRKLTTYRYHKSSSNFPSWRANSELKKKRIEFYKLSTKHWAMFYSFSLKNSVKTYALARQNYCYSVVSILKGDAKGIIISLANLFLLGQLRFSEPLLNKRLKIYLGMFRELFQIFRAQHNYE